MDLQIKRIKNRFIQGEIRISGSKSESNRLLILQKLYPNIQTENLSNSDDTNHLIEALSSEKDEINIGHAGTAMRFLTAYFALQKSKTVVLSGSERMHNRPIKVLVEALVELGAEIEYLEKDGYPPLKIFGKSLTHNHVKMNGNVSSQYISALLLVASRLPNGLTVDLEGEITSIPYLKMTLSLLNQLGVPTSFQGQTIRVEGVDMIKSQTVLVESDWSSASYFYSIIALSDVGSSLVLQSYKRGSLQGDSTLSEIYKSFGVETKFSEGSIRLEKSFQPTVNYLELNLNKAPDIAQTIAVTCFGLRLSCSLTGLHTLKIKETDRLVALENELTKLGAKIFITNDSLTLESSSHIVSNVSIKTYDDHRMAMAFAPLGILTNINIMNAEVVTKSYQNFWNDLKKIGFQFSN